MNITPTFAGQWQVDKSITHRWGFMPRGLSGFCEEEAAAMAVALTKMNPQIKELPGTVLLKYNRGPGKRRWVDVTFETQEAQFSIPKASNKTAVGLPSLYQQKKLSDKGTTRHELSYEVLNAQNPNQPALFGPENMSFTQLILAIGDLCTRNKALDKKGSWKFDERLERFLEHQYKDQAQAHLSAFKEVFEKNQRAIANRGNSVKITYGAPMATHDSSPIVRLSTHYQTSKNKRTTEEHFMTLKADHTPAANQNALQKLLDRVLRKLEQDKTIL